MIPAHRIPPPAPAVRIDDVLARWLARYPRTARQQRKYRLLTPEHMLALVEHDVLNGRI